MNSYRKINLIIIIIIIQDNSTKLKTILISEIDQMINMLEMKKKELVDFIEIEKTSKIKASKGQISFLSSKIQKTTGLLQFCVETLKEQDPSSFLQVIIKIHYLILLKIYSIFFSLQDFRAYD